MNGRRVRSKKSKSNKITCLLAIIGVLVAGFFINMETSGMRAESEALKADNERLQAEYEAESKRTEELEQERIYVQTKQYIEEEAKKLGYIYPNEIIFKPVN